MDAQTLSLLCVPLAAAAVAFIVGILALKDITLEKLGDTSEGAEARWKKLFRNLRDENKLGNFGKICEAAADEELRIDGYVMDRIETIYEALNSSHRVRKVPSLSDLRALSEQRAQSRFSANFFRSLTPSILVLGIGCTLLGVHGVLSRRVIGDQMMILLGEALCPGAVAVVCTIVLFVLRGIYNRSYAALIQALDKLTMDCLFQHFREPDTALTSLTDFVRHLDEGVGGTGQRGMNLREGMQKFRGALMQWTEVSDGCLKTLTHVTEQMCSIGEDAQDIQEEDEDCFRMVREMLGNMLKRTNNRSQSTETLLTQTYPVLSSLREVLQSISEISEIRDRGYRRFIEQGKRLREMLPTMGAGQTTLREDEQNCDQLVRWLQELSALTARREEEVRVGMQMLLPHLREQQSFLASQVKALSETSESYVDQMRSSAHGNVVALIRWLFRINEQARSYENIIQKQNERCRKILSGSHYPAGLWGIYMRIADAFCRWKWSFYALVFVLILIFV